MHELENNRKKLVTQEKKINDQLTETEEEIADFQKEKMAKLNQLDMSVVLKVKQIQNLVEDEGKVARWCQMRQEWLEEREKAIAEGAIDIGNMDREQAIQEERQLAQVDEDYRGFFLPKQLKNSVLFTRMQLRQLLNRKQELDEEISNLTKEQRENSLQTDQFIKQKKEKQKEREEKKREYEEKQMLRFGNIVDLDSLEVSGPSQYVLELQNKFHKKEQACIKSIEEADAEFQKTQRELTSCI